MNIIEFKEKVYQRVISRYINDVRKAKPNWKDYLYFPILISIPVIVFTIAYHLIKNDYKSDFLLLIGVLLCFLGLLVSIYSAFNIKFICNFKKHSNNFWGTTILNLPLLDNENLKNLIENVELPENSIHHSAQRMLFCRKEYTKEDLNKLLMFTHEELADMNTVSFNKSQKDLLIYKIAQDLPINFYCLEELVYMSDINQGDRKNKHIELIKEKMNNSKFILNAIKFEKEIESELGCNLPMNIRIKDLL